MNIDLNTWSSYNKNMFHNIFLKVINYKERCFCWWLLIANCKYHITKFRLHFLNAVRLFQRIWIICIGNAKEEMKIIGRCLHMCPWESVMEFSWKKLCYTFFVSLHFGIVSYILLMLLKRGTRFVYCFLLFVLTNFKII